MNKRISVIVLLFLVIGCQKEPEKSTTVCTFEGVDSGIDIKQEVELYAGDDKLYTIKGTDTFTFENIDRYQKDIDARMAAYKEKETCAEKTGSECNESMTFEWELKDNQLSTITTIDIRKAIENEEELSIFKEVPKDDEYISLKQIIEALKNGGYDCGDTKIEKAK